MTAFAQDSGVSVLRLNGENDALLTSRLRSELTSAVAGRAPVVVDLTGATSIDAAVIRILLEGLAESEKHEHVLLLLLPDDASSPVHRLFQLTGLAGLLPVVSTWDEALRRAGPWPASEHGQSPRSREVKNCVGMVEPCPRQDP